MHATSLPSDPPVTPHLERNPLVPWWALCAAVVAICAVVRAVVAAQGWLYWDDLLLFARARTAPTPTLEFLFQPHDGHLMPGAWLVEWLLARGTQLPWTATLITVTALHVISLIAVAWMVTVIASGGRGTRPSPWALIAVAVYGLSPLTLTATSWAASTVNSLPLHASLAAVIGLSVTYLRRRTRGRWMLAALAAVTLVGCAFSERMLYGAPVAVIIAWLVHRVTDARETAGLTGLSGHTGPKGLAGPKWLTGLGASMAAVGLVVVPWAGLYLWRVGDPRPGQAEVASAASFIWHTYAKALAPTLAGGPWRWQRWHPGPPWGDGPDLLAVIGVVALVAGIIAVLLSRRHNRASGLALIAVVAAYPLIPTLAVALVRSGPNTAAEIMQTMRHISETAVFLPAVLTAVLTAVPTPTSAAGLPAPAAAPGLARGGAVGASARIIAAVALTAAWVASSGISTVNYARAWSEQPAREYFTNLERDLAGRNSPILDQDVDLNVLLPLAYPDNRLSRLMPGQSDDATPLIAAWTTEPSLVAPSGRVIPAQLWPMRSTLTGPDGTCGTRIEATETATLGLDGPLIERQWVVLLNYLADNSGYLEVDLGAEAVQVPVEAGLHQVYVQVTGGNLPDGGSGIRVSPRASVGALCVQTSNVGVLAPR